MKKFILTFVVLITIVSCFTFSVNANGPAPPRGINVYAEKLPENALYIDLLIKVDSNDKNFTSINSINIEKYNFANDAEIIKYNKDGFQSYTFHFKDSISKMNIVDNESSFTYETESNNSQFYTIKSEYNLIKVALLDENGNIIKVSNEINVSPKKIGFFTGAIYCDFETNSIDIGFYDSPFNLIIFLFGAIFIGGLRILFTVLTETLIAIPFKLKPVWQVAFVNLFTQLILTTIMALTIAPYLKLLIIMEIAVYLIEFIAFRLLYKDLSTKRLALFVIVANTVSLSIGLLLNSLGIFIG